MTENRGGNPGCAGEIVPGFKAVPMQPETGVYYWPVCVVVAVDPAEPVMLANLPGSRAYLGCVLTTCVNVIGVSANSNVVASQTGKRIASRNVRLLTFILIYWLPCTQQLHPWC